MSTQIQDKFRLNLSPPVRMKILAGVFILWAAALNCRLFYFMHYSRDQHLTEMQNEVLKEGKIPALRGRILDARGRNILAWSTRHYGLFITIPETAKKFNILLSTISNVIKINKRKLRRRNRLHWKKELRLATNLTPEEIVLISKKFGDNPNIFLKVYFQRHYNSRYANMIGKTKATGLKEIGVKGLEKKYNAQLTGKNLVYNVIVNSSGNWVKGTYQVLQKMEPGFDVYAKEIQGL